MGFVGTFWKNNIQEAYLPHLEGFKLGKSKLIYYNKTEASNSVTNQRKSQ